MYSTGMDTYTKKCYEKMPPMKENIRGDMNATSLKDDPNVPLHWTGECGNVSL